MCGRKNKTNGFAPLVLPDLQVAGRRLEEISNLLLCTVDLVETWHPKATQLSSQRLLNKQPAKLDW